PVGISFYTFQTMSYTIDIYRKEIKATKNPLDFALFVAFFPQLVAGPIVRAATFLPQLTKDVRISCDQTTFFLIIRGLAKKVLIADNLAIFIDPVFSSPGSWPSIIIWLATIAFAIQIYCDFSGYSDIAIGIARILGFTLPQNFNHPYSARNPSDFWERWHISLSSWLRDYLYISLGGNRGSAMATYRNLMLTMLLGGLWHGASWNFLIWGLLHGSILVAHRLYTGLRKKANPEWRAGKGLFTYLISLLLMQYFVMLTWISFRLTDFDALQTAMHKFVVFDFDFDLTGIGLGNLAFFSSIALMAIFILFTIVSQRTGHIENYLGRLSTAKAAMVCFISGFVFYYLWPLTQAPFIYFQF
ncbi:MAG: MBOAT family O-acyltransferase, partial [Gammaproteobacteria bacterium]|nr:MBOAT family O-acyltransferase [Gammaproteobacteria bacterium]